MCQPTSQPASQSPTCQPPVTSTGRKDDGVQGVPVTFDGVNYSVTLEKGKELRIIKGLSGAFIPGKLTALMGPSGSGKSTLLDCLAGRKNSGLLSGSVLFGGRKPTISDYRLTVGYVEQFDTLVGELTVEQMLQYTAELKLPTTFSPEDRTARVNEVISLLELESCRSNVIGNELSRGISGGQAKRVNIALSLITRPPILFLDEPTTGLDSRASNEVCELLRKLAQDGGRTIVCTIHSPSGIAFQKFDDLYMIIDGEVVYDGPVSKVQSYFETLGHDRHQDSSLPEWLVDLTSSPTVGEGQACSRSDEESSAIEKQRLINFVHAFASSEIRKSVQKEREALLEDVTLMTLQDEASTASPSQFSKLCTLWKYRSIPHFQDGEFMVTRFGDKVLFAFLILSLYFNIGQGTDTQSMASVSSLLMLVVGLCGFGSTAFVPTLTLERKLFYRELDDGCYTATTYFLNKFMEEAFVALFTSLFFSIIVFFGMGLTGTFGVFFLAYYLTTMIAVMLAYSLAAALPTLEAANVLLPAYVTFCLFFGGLFIAYDKIPIYWQWFSWTSFLRYAWSALLVDNYTNAPPEIAQAAAFFDPEGNPLTVLEFYEMVDGPITNSVWASLGMLVALLVFFAMVGMAAIVHIRHDKR